MSRRLPAVVLVFAGAVAVGLTAGVGSVATSGGAPAVTAIASAAAVSAGIQRGRAPQRGDHWGGCDDARGAGTAPIYAGEPGYRTDMDGDGDGIACEPVR